MICIYNAALNEDSFSNPIHERLEVVLNHFGYYCDYYDINALPNKTDNYSAIVYWGFSNQIDHPIDFLKWLADNKDNKKIIFIGDIPIKNAENTFITKVNQIVESNFGFRLGGYWYENTNKVKITKKSDIYDFESKLSQMTIKTFDNIEILDKDIQPLLILEYQDINIKLLSTPVFIAKWGAFAASDKIFYVNDLNEKRWLINPFKFIKMVLNTDYPIPDTTTKSGKRIFYIHIDGDATNSISEVSPQKFCSELWYEKIGKGFPHFKTGVSFIAGDIDEKYRGSGRLQKIAREIFALPNVEAASHTYTHPLNWSKSIVAIGSDDQKREYHGFVIGLKPKDGVIDHLFEIKGSVDFINKFTPDNKKTNVLYWSGDCMPTKKDLEIADENNILAFNNGDTFFDLKHNSYSYVTPIGRDVDGIKQIYSSNSNENIYTYAWTRDFWALTSVLETYKNTGYPIRIKPINLYYHFYSLSKVASLNALLKIYKFIDSEKDSLSNIYPSEFIKIARNFFNVKIYKINDKKFKIADAYDLKEFRLDGKVSLKTSENVNNIYYDSKLNSTYIRLGDKPEAMLDLE